MELKRYVLGSIPWKICSIVVSLDTFTGNSLLPQILVRALQWFKKEIAARPKDGWGGLDTKYILCSLIYCFGIGQIKYRMCFGDIQEKFVAL